MPQRQSSSDPGYAYGVELILQGKPAELIDGAWVITPSERTLFGRRPASIELTHLHSSGEKTRLACHALADRINQLLAADSGRA